MQNQFHEETKDYGMHPAIFDRTIHSITEHIHGIALPYTCQSIKIFRQVPAEILVYGFCDSPGSEITERLLMLDMNGNLVAEIKGYAQRKFLRKGMEVWNGRNDGQSAGSSWIMEPQKKGVFDSFSARDVTLPSLHPDQVSIETKARGAQFSGCSLCSWTVA